MRLRREDKTDVRVLHAERVVHQEWKLVAHLESDVLVLHRLEHLDEKVEGKLIRVANLESRIRGRRDRGASRRRTARREIAAKLGGSALARHRECSLASLSRCSGQRRAIVEHRELDQIAIDVLGKLDHLLERRHVRLVKKLVIEIVELDRLGLLVKRRHLDLEVHLGSHAIDRLELDLCRASLLGNVEQVLLRHILEARRERLLLDAKGDRLLGDRAIAHEARLNHANMVRIDRVDRQHAASTGSLARRDGDENVTQDATADLDELAKGLEVLDLELELIRRCRRLGTLRDRLGSDSGRRRAVSNVSHRGFSSSHGKGLCVT